jgi:hypothetical protein
MDWNSWSPGQIIRHFTQQAPVDVTALAGALGIKVWEKPLVNISGMVAPDPHNGGTSGYSIYVNSTDSETRRRFTIAHEIAHFLLHRNKDTKEFKDNIQYRSPGMSDELEAQANRLAADILMPRRLIRQLLDQGVTQPNDLAKKLGVSARAMEIRLGLDSRPKNPGGANRLAPSVRQELSESFVGNK